MSNDMKSTSSDQLTDDITEIYRRLGVLSIDFENLRDYVYRLYTKLNENQKHTVNIKTDKILEFIGTVPGLDAVITAHGGVVCSYEHEGLVDVYLRDGRMIRLTPSTRDWRYL